MHHSVEYLKGLIDRENVACNQIELIFNKFYTLSKSNNFGFSNAV